MRSFFLSLAHTLCVVGVVLLGACRPMLSPGEEGSSLKTAIEFETSNYFEGIALEHQWLEARYPGYEKQGQMLTSHGRKVYDVITIITAEGVEKEPYVDITSFYGKW